MLGTNQQRKKRPVHFGSANAISPRLQRVECSGIFFQSWVSECHLHRLHPLTVVYLRPCLPALRSAVNGWLLQLFAKLGKPLRYCRLSKVVVFRSSDANSYRKQRLKKTFNFAPVRLHDAPKRIGMVFKVASFRTNLPPSQFPPNFCREGAQEGLNMHVS